MFILFFGNSVFCFFLGWISFRDGFIIIFDFFDEEGVLMLVILVF